MSEPTLHLAHAIAIADSEPNPARWQARIDDLPAPAREPVRRWLDADRMRKQADVDSRRRNSERQTKRVDAAWWRLL
jgi:hypothetical protein